MADSASGMYHWDIMGIEWRKVCVCFVCKHEWLPVSDPSTVRRCSSCKSALWVDGQPLPKQTRPGLPAPPRQLPPDPPPVAQVEARQPVKLRGRKAKPVSAPVPSPVPSIRTCERIDQPTRPAIDPAPVLPVSAQADNAAARLVAVLSAPRPRPGEKCPHGWANWFQCPACNPRR